MSDEFTNLNVGTGGSTMDESGVQYPSGPSIRKRPRIVLAGEGKDEIVRVMARPPQASEPGLVVRSMIAEEHPGVAFWAFSEVTQVPSDNEVTISAYTVPADKCLYVTGFYISGDVNGKFIIAKNTDRILAMRTSVAKLSEMGVFNVVRPIVAAGETIAIKVIHKADGIRANFEATILGYVVDTY